MTEPERPPEGPGPVTEGFLAGLDGGKEFQDYFAGLRVQMEAVARKTLGIAPGVSDVIQEACLSFIASLSRNPEYWRGKHKEDFNALLLTYLRRRLSII